MLAVIILLNRFMQNLVQFAVSGNGTGSIPAALIRQKRLWSGEGQPDSGFCAQNISHLGGIP